MQALINVVRNAGAKTEPVVLGRLSYAGDFSSWVSSLPVDPFQQIAADYHIYGGNGCDISCAAAQILPVPAARYPVINGEIGEFDCGHSFVNGFMNWADAQNPELGYMGWSWRTDSCSTFSGMLDNMDGTPNGFGVGVRDHLALVNP